MATEHRGKAKHQRTGRVTPHGPGERIIEAIFETDQEPQEESLRREPPVEYKREQADDVPGLRKKIR
jgi:hypothetical protein